MKYRINKIRNGIHFKYIGDVEVKTWLFWKYLGLAMGDTLPHLEIEAKALVKDYIKKEKMPKVLEFEYDV